MSDNPIDPQLWVHLENNLKQSHLLIHQGIHIIKHGEPTHIAKAKLALAINQIAIALSKM